MRFLDRLLAKPKADRIPPDRFEQFSVLIAKQKNASVKRVVFHIFLYDRKQAICSFAQIRFPEPHKYSHMM
jgi:hypothetical protein